MEVEKTQKEKLVILGRGRFAQEVLDIIKDTKKHEVDAFIENWDKNKIKQSLLGCPIVWMDEAKPMISTHKAVCALGTTRRQSFIKWAIEVGFEFATIIHPFSRISSNSSIFEGSILCPGVIVSAYTTIGKHVIINRGGLIGHHTKIHDYVTVSPGANIAGSVTIGEGTYVGMGAVVLGHLTIGSHAVIGAGAVVTKDVPDRVQVMGIPARITRENINGM